MSRRIRKTGIIKGEVGFEKFRWQNIVDFNFADMGAQDLTDAQENTIAGQTFWLDGLSGTGTCAIVNGTGMNFSFPNQSGAFCVLLWKGVSHPKIDGSWPRFRVVASWDNIVYSQNSDSVGLWLGGMPYNGTQKVPVMKFQYKRNSASAFVYKAAIRKGTLNASGSDVTASDVATSESDNLVMEVQEGACGMWFYRADEGTTQILGPGGHTIQASGYMGQGQCATGTNTYWDEGANNTGPYLGVTLRSNSNGSQAATLLRLVIQEYK